MAGALAVFGLAFAPSAGATATVISEQFAGANRYDTAKLISQNAVFTAPKSAIVATGQNFPDALAASTLAGSVRPAPIVLTATDSLSPEASAALTALKGKGVTTVHIVGGTSAVSQATEDAIKALGLTVVRHQGTGAAANRYGTASQIAQDSNAIAATGSVGGLKAAFFATGLNFADAVAAAPGAYAARLPVLLVNADVPAETQAAITALGIKKAIVLGGIGAVPTTVSDKLATLTGNPITRLEGTAAAGSSQDRFGTAAAIADFAVSTLGFANPTSVVIANGTDAKQGVDALAGGPLGGELKAPTLLVASCPPATSAWLSAHSTTVAKLYEAGGPGVIDPATDACLKAAAQGTPGAGSATTRPELVSAAILSTTTTGNATATSPAGTVVSYTFDEPVVAVSTTAFRVYLTNGTPISSTNASISSADNKVVNVLYPSINTAAGAGALTTATVLLGAVTDVSGQHSPEGDAGIGAGGSATLAAGTTAAPDLRTVAGFRATTTPGTVAVDFTFDSAAFVQGVAAGNFNLVSTDFRTVACTNPDQNSQGNTNPSGQNVVGGNGTTTITVTCGQFAAAGPLAAATASATNVARGYVLAGAVGTTPDSTATGPVNGVSKSSGGCGTANTDSSPVTNRCNPLEASDTPDSPSATPDLVSAAFVPTANPAAFDQVTYTFDENVQPGTVDSTKFGVYSSTGTETTAVAVPAPQVNGAQVAVFFPFGTLASAVGANVRAGGVTAVAGSNLANLADEVGVANATATTLTPDRTSGPDLLTVGLSSATVGFVTTYTATYTFDSAITGGQNAANFFLHLADGSRMVCNGGAGVFIVGTGLNGLTTSQASCNAFTFVDVVGGVDQSGTNTGAATAAQVGSAVLGTVAAAAVTGPTAVSNPEGAEFTTGGTGTRTA